MLSIPLRNLSTVHYYTFGITIYLAAYVGYRENSYQHVTRCIQLPWLLCKILVKIAIRSDDVPKILWSKLILNSIGIISIFYWAALNSAIYYTWKVDYSIWEMDYFHLKSNASCRPLNIIKGLLATWKKSDYIKCCSLCVSVSVSMLFNFYSCTHKKIW